MAVNKAKKNEMLKELIDKFNRSKSIVFTKNLGLSNKDMAELRNKLREKEIEFKVAKKTLIRLAAKELGITEIPDEIIEGPIGAAMSYEDQVSAANILHKYTKTNKKIELVGGIVDKELLNSIKIIHLATLPTKNELIAKFMGSLKAPVNGFYSVLNNVLGGFVRVVNAYKDQKTES
jgi:large subunit ribosomal protein L10